MKYSQELETIITAIVNDGDSVELREKAHRQAILDGDDPDEVDIIIKGRIVKSKKNAEASVSPLKDLSVSKPSLQENANTTDENAANKILNIKIIGAALIVIIAIGMWMFSGENNVDEVIVQSQDNTTELIENGAEMLEPEEMKEPVLAESPIESNLSIENETQQTDNSEASVSANDNDALAEFFGDVVEEESSRTPSKNNEEDLIEEITDRIENIYAEGPDAGNSLFVFKKFCSKDFCITFEKYEKAIGEDFGSLDYDVWTQAQDIDNFSVEVLSVKIKNSNKAEAKLAIHNFGKKKTIRLLMVKENGKWMIDDFVNTDHSAKTLMKEDIPN